MNCDFSLAHYKECIELAKDKGYSIIPVKDYQQQKKVIILRHDIDWSLEYAYELANIEYDLGINSSYFVYLHSELYNALSPKAMGMLKSIREMGHEIGLHYNSKYDIEEEDILVASIIGTSIDSVTHHFPKSNVLKLYLYLTNPNALKLKYLSDSGRNWREKCMCNWIGKEDKLHINIHPEWWITESESREHAVHKMWNSALRTLVANMTGVKDMLSDYERELKL